TKQSFSVSNPLGRALLRPDGCSSPGVVAGVALEAGVAPSPGVLVSPAAGVPVSPVSPVSPAALSLAAAWSGGTGLLVALQFEHAKFKVESTSHDHAVPAWAHWSQAVGLKSMGSSEA